jgi:hypothetical protein
MDNGSGIYRARASIDSFIERAFWASPTQSGRYSVVLVLK